MRRNVVAGLLAFTAVGVLAAAFSTTFLTRAEPQRMVAVKSYNVASGGPPSNKFGFAEAVSSAVDVPPPVAPAVNVEQPSAIAEAAASEAAAAASEAAMAADDERVEIPPATALAPGMPKIAYSYRYGYEVDARRIPELQRSHADLCERQGPQVCRIVSLEQHGEADGDFARGRLVLAVASPRARAFGTELAQSVKAAGGSELSSAISGEDLSKAIVDTEARLRARTLLRDRLMDVLASRKGTVAELVEAERGVAQVNEEIDQARSWLAEMKGRVEYSSVSIDYQPGGAAIAHSESGGFFGPIRAMLGNVGAILGTMIAVLIAVATMVLPIGLLGWAGHRIWRRFRPAQIENPEADEPYAA